MNKLSIRHSLLMQKISKRDINKKDFVKHMKESIKKDPVVVAKFKEYDVPIDEIDNVHVEFCELDVSAKTKDQKIYLNEKMLEPDSDVDDPTHYLAHEIIHYLQQATGNVSGHKEVDEYLDKPTEVEAFQVQVEFKENNEGKEESKKYLEDLLDHHEYEGKDRKEKKEELLDD